MGMTSNFGPTEEDRRNKPNPPPPPPPKGRSLDKVVEKPQVVEEGTGFWSGLFLGWLFH